MISQNTILVKPDYSSHQNALPTLQFKYFHLYAKFLLNNKLEEFAFEELKLARELDLPLLKFFQHFSEEKMAFLCIKNVRELLSCCAINNANQYITGSIEKVFNNKPHFFIKTQVTANDITLLSFIKRRLLNKFITGYTNDTKLIFNILKEIDLFTMQMDSAAFKAYIKKSNSLAVELATRNEEIKLKELQHQRMINEIEDYAILLMDKEGFILNWNKGAEKIKGYSSNEIIGKNFRVFYRREDQEKKLPEMLIHEAGEKGKAMHEGWRVRKDGTTFWGYIVITALHDENNNVIGFSKITRNLTERKLAEDTLKEYTHRIEKHNEELQRINKDLDSFTYMASHDLQEPLRKIRTFCNMILSKSKEDLPPDISVYFDRIIVSVERMQNLIDSLLNYSRTATREVALTTVDLRKVVEEVKKDFAELIEEKKVTINCDVLPVLSGEQSQFYQLFCNLIENAIKYRCEDKLPVITISAGKMRKWVEGEDLEFHKIIIKDNGIGFEQKYADDIFKLFQRLHGRSEYSGTGIGLAICKKIVENHKGKITAVSELGKGSSFNIFIPVDNKKAEEKID